MENFDAEQPMEDLQEQTPKKEPKNPLYDCYSLLHDLVYILAAITIVFVFFVRLVGVDGPSMMPTLQDGDYVALLSNLFMGDLEQGDVIVARKESFENGEPIVKRVIATEGQTVDILYDGNGYGTVYVDGEPLDEPYILEPMVLPYYDRTSFPLTVDEGCLVVMGDNRNRSADSRYASIGQIEESQVIGKVLCKQLLLHSGGHGGAGGIGLGVVAYVIQKFFFNGHFQSLLKFLCSYAGHRCAKFILIVHLSKLYCKRGNKKALFSLSVLK